MRYMIMIEASEQQGSPPPELMQEMGRSMQELLQKGVMVAVGGLLPSSAGARVSLSGADIRVTDGPFAEGTELVGGYSIVEVASREEAVALAQQVVEIHRDHWPGWQGAAEVRQLMAG